MKMNRLLLTFAAVVCILSLSAGTASAFFKTSFNQYPTTITARNVGAHIFNVGTSLTTECKGAEFQGNAQNPGPAGGSQLTVRPIYNECEAKSSLGTSAITVKTNGCVYNFHQAKGVFKGSVTIECPPGKTIEFKTFTCTLKIGSQGPISGITYSNEGSPKKVLVKASLTGIKFTSEGCFGVVPAEGENAEYKGEARTEGKYNGSAEGVEVV
jgi:hypothetical protein